MTVTDLQISNNFMDVKENQRPDPSFINTAPKHIVRFLRGISCHVLYPMIYLFVAIMFVYLWQQYTFISY